MLKHEYSDVYSVEGRSLTEARTLMAERNPNLAGRTPREAKEALDSQYNAFVESKPPFDQPIKPSESVRDYFQRIGRSAGKDGDVLSVSITLLVDTDILTSRLYTSL